jgi:hypothetical protein
MRAGEWHEVWISSEGPSEGMQVYDCHFSMAAASIKMKALQPAFS